MESAAPKCDEADMTSVCVAGLRHAEFRPVEWVVIVFFGYTVALATILPISGEMRSRIFAVTAAVLASIIGLAAPRRWLCPGKGDRRRYCFFLALIPVAYKMMGWFAPDVHDHALERLWIGWDHVILKDWRGQQLVQAVGSAGPWLLELAYLLVYAVGPCCVLVLYLFRREHRTHDFLLTYILSLLLCYGQFPFWPSEPPRTVFAGDLEPMANSIRAVNLYIVGNAGIHTSVFPSAHVSGAFGAAFGFWSLFPDKRWLRCAPLAYAILVSIATVYGRYHYTVDAVAGIAVAAVAFGVAQVLINSSSGFRVTRRWIQDRRPTDALNSPANSAGVVDVGHCGT